MGASRAVTQATQLVIIKPSRHGIPGMLSNASSCRRCRLGFSLRTRPSLPRSLPAARAYCTRAHTHTPCRNHPSRARAPCMPTKELDAANTSHAKRGTHDDYRSIAYSPVVANDSGGYVRASGLGTSRHARYQLVQPRRRATTRPSGLPHVRTVLVSSVCLPWPYASPANNILPLGPTRRLSTNSVY